MCLCSIMEWTGQQWPCSGNELSSLPIFLHEASKIVQCKCVCASSGFNGIWIFFVSPNIPSMNFTLHSTEVRVLISERGRYGGVTEGEPTLRYALSHLLTSPCSLNLIGWLVITRTNWLHGFHSWQQGLTQCPFTRTSFPHLYTHY